MPDHEFTYDDLPIRPGDIEFHEADEWTAVYVHGTLARDRYRNPMVGNSYLADEWLRELFGVKTVQDDAFMLGQDGRDGVARHTGEIVQYATAREERKAAAATLREQAAALARQAAEIENGAST